MLRLIRKILLKSNHIKRVVFAYQVKQHDQRYHSNWELIMRGQAVRDMETEKPEPPLYLDSINWGR